MKPKISVIIAAYNEEKRLSLCLNSLAKQSYPKDSFEIIVVDNGSQDKTLHVAKQFTSKAFMYKEIQGCGAARAFGTKHATGEIIAFTDADSIVAENWLVKIDEYLTNPSLMCVSGKILPDKKSLWFAIVFHFYNIFFLVNNFFHKPLIWGPNMAIKKSAYDAIGGIDHTLLSSDDWDLGVRVQQHFGKKSVQYKQDLFVYTEVRKVNSPKIFLRYTWDGILNYTNMILLNRKKVKPVFNVR